MCEVGATICVLTEVLEATCFEQEFKAGISFLSVWITQVGSTTLPENLITPSEAKLAVGTKNKHDKSRLRPNMERPEYTGDIVVIGARDAHV